MLMWDMGCGILDLWCEISIGECFGWEQEQRILLGNWVFSSRPSDSIGLCLNKMRWVEDLSNYNN